MSSQWPTRPTGSSPHTFLTTSSPTGVLAFPETHQHIPASGPLHLPHIPPGMLFSCFLCRGSLPRSYTILFKFHLSSKAFSDFSDHLDGHPVPFTSPLCYLTVLPTIYHHLAYCGFYMFIYLPICLHLNRSSARGGIFVFCLLLTSNSQNSAWQIVGTQQAWLTEWGNEGRW